MPFVKKDRVRETTTTSGTGAITTAGAPGGYQSFSAVMNIGDTCWYGIVMPGSAWETGLGTYSAVNTITRTTVLESSNSNALVSFPAGSKDVFICQPASQAQPAFPSGTLMLFQQTSAPTYWTKQTSHNDKALRVVSGAAGSGGTNAFSTVMAQTTVAAHALTIGEMPNHNHAVSGGVNGTASGPVGVGTGAVIGMANAVAITLAAQGGGGSHTHGITMDMLYVDLIIASKD